MTPMRFTVPGLSLGPILVQRRIVRRRLSFNLDVTFDRNVHQLRQRDGKLPPLTCVNRRVESPSRVASRHEVLFSDPAFSFVGVSPARPSPEHLKHSVIDVPEHLFACTVSVVITPASKLWIESEDYCLRLGGEISTQPGADSREERENLFLLRERVAAAFELTDVEAKKIDSLANVSDAGFILVQLKASLS